LQENTFEEHVFPTEILEIRARRNAEGLPAGSLSDRPTPENDLVGLAISGGGVRSASIALGVVQALSRRGVLRRVDYLSTVSGGGFLGSCISALLHRPYAGTSPEDFPLNHLPGSGEPPALAHVRSYCAYLAPEGFVDTIRIPALLVRGVLINIFTTLPFLLAAVALTDFFYLNVQDFRLYVPALIFMGLSLFLVLSLAYPLVGRLFRRNFRWGQRNTFTQFLGLSFFSALGLLLTMPLLLMIWLSIMTSWDSLVFHVGSELVQLVKDLRSPVPWVAMGAIVLITFAALRSIEPLRGFMTKAAIYPVGLIGPGLLFFTYLLLCVTFIQPPYVDSHFAEALEQGEVPPGLLNELGNRDIDIGDAPQIIAVAKGVWKIDGQPHDVAIEYNEMLGGEYLFLESDQLEHSSEYLIVGSIVLVLMVVLIFYDVNVTSLHGFYRDRLSRAWLITMTPDKPEPQHVDHLRLSELREPGSRAPYHLIHAAVNSSEMEPRLHGRAADFFLFSKHWIGGELAGWCPTGVMERYDPALDLGTAMAISGAAAAPQMGDATIRPLAILMAMLNVRMAYWLPNPGLARNANWLAKLRMWRGAGPQYLISEALGTASLHNAHILVSDGGHIENLGVYALLQRRCRFIMAVDGEQDGGRHCPSLLRVLRYARVDMGIDIDIDLSPIKLGENGESERSWIVGTIHYSGGQTGTLMYMKSTLTGHESAEIKEFKRRFPAFPHDSTADQFFDPERFEMYRLLGWQMAQTAIDEASSDPVIAPFLADVDAHSIHA